MPSNRVFWVVALRLISAMLAFSRAVLTADTVPKPRNRFCVTVTPATLRVRVNSSGSRLRARVVGLSMCSGPASALSVTLGR